MIKTEVVFGLDISNEQRSMQNYGKKRNARNGSDDASWTISGTSSGVDASFLYFTSKTMHYFVRKQYYWYLTILS